MPLTLDQQSVSDLIDYVDRNVRASGCDHSRRYCAAWANERGIDWDDLLDALDAAGAFCDCEVVLNLEDGPLTYDPAPCPVDRDNRWLLPPNISLGPDTTTTKIIVSRANVGRNTHTKEGEWLIPAPMDAKPRKRVRKIVHFFIGVESGLPAEIGFVADIDPLPVARFVDAIAECPVSELHGCDRRVASYILGRIAKLPGGTPVGTGIIDHVGVASKHRELNVHRVILRR